MKITWCFDSMDLTCKCAAVFQVKPESVHVKQHNTPSLDIQQPRGEMQPSAESVRVKQHNTTSLDIQQPSGERQPSGELVVDEKIDF